MIRFTVTVNGENKKTVWANTLDEAEQKILDDLGITVADIVSGKVNQGDIIFGVYQRNPFKINVFDKRNIEEAEFEVIEDE